METKPKYVVVDVKNIAHEGRPGKPPSYRHFLDALDELKNWDELAGREFKFLLIADASFKHRVPPEEQKLVEDAEREELLRHVPARTEADEWILKRAERLNALVVSNDKYSDRQHKFPWLLEQHRVIAAFFMEEGGWDVSWRDLGHDKRKQPTRRTQTTKTNTPKAADQSSGDSASGGDQSPRSTGQSPTPSSAAIPTSSSSTTSTASDSPPGPSTTAKATLDATSAESGNLPDSTTTATVSTASSSSDTSALRDNSVMSAEPASSVGADRHTTATPPPSPSARALSATPTNPRGVNAGLLRRTIRIFLVTVVVICGIILLLSKVFSSHGNEGSSGFVASPVTTTPGPIAGTPVGPAIPVTNAPVELPAQVTLVCMSMGAKSSCAPNDGTRYSRHSPIGFSFQVTELTVGDVEKLCQAGWHEEWSDDKGVIPHSNRIGPRPWGNDNVRCTLGVERAPHKPYVASIPARHAGVWPVTWTLKDENGNVVYSASLNLTVP
jgi:Zc3h12a-like Ribonuclease NYN domain